MKNTSISKAHNVSLLSVAMLLIFLLLNSCVTTRKTTYLQEYKKSEYPEGYTPPDNYLIQPNDNLYIRVSTPDPRWSALFNPMSGGGGMQLSGDNVNLVSYPVQLDGTVDLPYIGSVNVIGKTLSEVKDIIESIMIDYVADAAVSVLLVNNYVTILGEVNAPGMYPITKERLNVFQAIAMAGDLAPFSNRYRLQIVRQTMEGSVIKEFDITDKNFVDSEFYYVLPNDVIYAKPMKGKFFGMTNFTPAMILTTLTTVVSLIILIQNYLIIQQY